MRIWKHIIISPAGIEIHGYNAKEIEMLQFPILALQMDKMVGEGSVIGFKQEGPDEET